MQNKYCYKRPSDVDLGGVCVAHIYIYAYIQRLAYVYIYIYICIDIDLHRAHSICLITYLEPHWT